MTVQDPAGDLDVALFDGDRRVTPENSPHTMATDEVHLPAAQQYGVGDEITALLDNTDNSADIDVSVLVTGADPAVIDE